LKPDSLPFKAIEFYGTRMHHRGQWRVHSYLRSLLKADIDKDLEVTRRGLRWLLNPSDYIQSEFFWIGSMQSWDTHHFLRLLRPGSTIFDAGANFGYFSLLACAALKGNCQVFAFEPNPPTYERLMKNIELNQLGGHIRAYPVGLSDAAGTGFIVEKQGDSGWTRVSASSGGRKVKLTTMDDFCRTQRITRLDIAKIDIEGFEERLLRGATDCLGRFKPTLMIELNPRPLAFQNSSERRVVDLLARNGYELFFAAREKLVPLHLPLARPIVNAFCFHQARNITELM
jgi:FkbM family methyltransferase